VFAFASNHVMRCLTALSAATLAIALAGPASAQDTSYHDKLLAEAREQPLMKENLTTYQGKPLTDAQRLEVEHARKLMDEADNRALAGEFQAASDAASQALNKLRPILGDTHYLTVSARSMQFSYQKGASGDPAKKKDLTEALAALERAKDLHLTGDYIDAEKAAAEAVRLFTLVFGDQSALAAMALRELGKTQIELQRHQEAAKSLERALEIAEKVYGPNHPNTARVLDRLGWLQINKGEFRPATVTLRRAVRIMRTTEGDTRQAAEAIDNLGTAMAYSRYVDQALQNKLTSLVIREKLVGPDSWDAAISLSNLAWLYSQTGHRDDALPLRKRAISIFEKELGPQHPYTRLEKDNLAREYQRRKEYDDAIRVYRELIAVDSEGAARLDSSRIRRRSDLALALIARGDIDEAMKTVAAAVDAAKALHKEGLVSAATRELEYLSDSLQRELMVDDATRIMETVVAWDREREGAATDSVVERKLTLGALYITTGQPDKALAILRETAEQAKKLFGDESVQMGQIHLTQAAALESQEDFAAAEEHADEALKLFERFVSRKSNAYALALRTMGRIQAGLERYDMAIFNFEEARDIAASEKDTKPGPYIAVLEEMAGCHAAMDKSDEALKLLREARKMCRDLQKKFADVGRVDEIHATVLKRLDEVMATTGGSERESIRQELRSLLEGLRQRRALDAEGKKWLAELGGATS